MCYNTTRRKKEEERNDDMKNRYDDFAHKLEEMGYEMVHEEDQRYHRLLMISPRAEKENVNIVIFCSFRLTGMMEINVLEGSKLNNKYEHPLEVKQLVLEMIEYYAQLTNIQTIVLNTGDFIAEIAKQEGFIPMSEHDPFVANTVTNVEPHVLTKVKSIEAWQFALSFEDHIEHELQQLTIKYPGFEWSGRFDYLLYYEGMEQLLEWEIKRGNCIIEQVEAEIRHVVNTSDALGVKLEEIVSEMEKTMRIKNLFDPPTHHFKTYLGDLTQSTRDTIYQLLLMKMTAKEIEQTAAKMKKQAKRKIDYKDKELISFDPWFIGLKNITFQAGSIKTFDHIELFESIEQAKTFLQEQMAVN